MSQNKIPGSSGYALIGDKSYDFYKDPVHFCNSRIDSFGSRIFQARLLNKPTVFVCSVKGMKEMLCEKVNIFGASYTSSMCKLFGDVICFAHGEEAQLLRLSLMQLFNHKALETHRDYVNRVCTRNLKDLAQCREPVVIYEMFKRLATELVLGIFLNIDAEESAAFSKQITELSTQHWHGLISTPLNVKVSAWSSGFSQALEAKEKLLNIIDERLKSENEGFISKIKDVPFPESTSAAQHLLLFISALIPKALASLLTSFTIELAGSNKVQVRKRARENESYLDHVLLEVERLWPSFIGGRRVAKQDTTLCGYTVPKGTQVMFIAFAVHRDPEIFAEPDEFQPERWSGRNAGQETLLCCFGNGSRNCIGIGLNNLILKTAVGYLVNNYSWEMDPPTQSLHYKWLPVTRPCEDLKIKFTSCSYKNQCSPSTPDCPVHHQRSV
ncbi:uncharacterized protein LOC127572970 isoform X1 [Pristis pectinata]|uniref:uncharacterized protein LOC127572970 isoform X1 n=1 Tax=Pristis pectinata TaxID=685728 RepID=UPI00223E8A10|nr:uncharacterized protein LOC127572970 isoform X1 [Pristis pectinata]XP_051876664.1 uncharacterized protein LOC127572970 isoform X1 [Pristis pectinata]